MKKPTIPGAPALQGLEVEFDRACIIACQSNPDLRALGDELVQFVKTHERKPLVLTNLAHQLQRLEQFFSRGELLKNQGRRSATIETVAGMFVAAVKLKRDQDNWSPVRRIQETHKTALHDHVAQLIREVPRDGSPKEKN